MRFVIVASVVTATVSGAQAVRGPAFPARPPGDACAQRLERMRVVASPSVHRDTLMSALTPLFACKERELGQGVATAILGVRTTVDSSLAFHTYTPAFVYRDSAIMRASAEVAADRSASELMRVLGFLALYTTLARDGSTTSLSDFVTRPRDVTSCDGGFWTHQPSRVDLTPLPARLTASIGELATSVRDDPGSSRALVSAAACVLAAWRETVGQLSNASASSRLAVPDHEREQSSTRTLSETRVLVSAREVRVIYPPDTSGTWGWPTIDTASYAPRYYWDMLVDGIDGPRSLSLRIDQRDTTARTFPTLRSLVTSAKPGLCTGGMVMQCTPAGAAVSVDGDRVVLTFRDARTITRLFGLRPDSVRVTRSDPDDPAHIRSTRVGVEYVQPQIPIPDAAFRAEAERAKRRYVASINSIRRSIAGGPPGSSAMWVAVGDSVPVDVSETRCTHDVCHLVSVAAPSGVWSVDDTTVAHLAMAAPRVDLRLARLDPLTALPRMHVVGRTKGRTTLRVRLPVTPSDAMPAQKPPPRVLEREVVVSARAVRVELTPRPDTVHVGETVSLRVRVLDEGGNPLAGASVGVMHEARPGSNVHTTTTDVVEVTFAEAGPRTIVAKFGALSDTVRLTVVGAAKR